MDTTLPITKSYYNSHPSPMVRKLFGLQEFQTILKFSPPSLTL